MDTVQFYNCYDYNDDCYLIEMALDIPAHDINWIRFLVPQEGVRKSDWQCAFMEQYLNEDGTARICDLYDEPKENVKPCRIAFFIFKTPAEVLSTPYGDFLLSDPNPLPDRLADIIEFEESD